MKNNNSFFAIGIDHVKNQVNVGTLLRSAQVFGASFVFTVGRRYKKQSSDVWKTWRRIPLFHYETVDDLKKHLPYDCMLVGVELSSESKVLLEHVHMPRSCYLLGAEDHGLSAAQLKMCHTIIQIPGVPGETSCLNVATAGSIVMYDRFSKEQKE